MRVRSTTLARSEFQNRVLLKPGEFTDEEREVMSTHTTLGGDILSDSGSRLVQIAERIARTHHERWDGSGYPAGLGESRSRSRAGSAPSAMSSMRSCQSAPTSRRGASRPPSGRYAPRAGLRSPPRAALHGAGAEDRAPAHGLPEPSPPTPDSGKRFEDPCFRPPLAALRSGRNMRLCVSPLGLGRSECGSPHAARTAPPAGGAPASSAATSSSAPSA